MSAHTWREHRWTTPERQRVWVCTVCGRAARYWRSVRVPCPDTKTGITYAERLRYLEPVPVAEGRHCWTCTCTI